MIVPVLKNKFLIVMWKRVYSKVLDVSIGINNYMIIILTIFSIIVPLKYCGSLDCKWNILPAENTFIYAKLKSFEVIWLIYFEASLV